MTIEGGLSRWEAMRMTNLQRMGWINAMNKRNAKIAEANEKASKGSGK